MDQLASRFLLKSFWDWIDHFLFYAMANAVALLMCVVPAGIAYALTDLIPILAASPFIGAPFGMAGLFACAAVGARGGDPDWSTFRMGIRRGWKFVSLLLFVVLVTPLSVVVGVLFYPPMLGAAGYLLAGVMMWIGLGVMLVAALTAPGVFLGEQSPGHAVRTALFLLMLRPGVVMFVGMWALLWLALTFVGLPLMLPFVSLAVVAVGSTSAWAVMMRQHVVAQRNAVDAAPESDDEEPTAEDAAPAKPRSWKEVREMQKASGSGVSGLSPHLTASAPESVDDDNEVDDVPDLPYMGRDELKRSWRDLVRPWDM